MSQSASDTEWAQADRSGRRSRLREFQSQLVERMQAARSGVDVRLNQLGVMIGDARWLISLKQTGEIVAPGAITPVPLTQDWFLGLTNIRGNLTSVIDLARFQGGAPVAIDKDCRIVAFAPALAFNSGLLVSRVLGLRNIAEMKIQPGPGGADALPGVGRCYVDRESQLWTELDLSLVVQDPRFLHVGL